MKKIFLSIIAIMMCVFFAVLVCGCTNEPNQADAAQQPNDADDQPETDSVPDLTPAPYIYATSGKDGAMADYYETVSVTFPANQDGRTEANKTLYDIEPFTVSFLVPKGWTISVEPQDEIYLGNGSFALTPVYIYNADGICIGAMGYDLIPYDSIFVEDYESAELKDIPISFIYTKLCVGNHYRFDISEYYIPVGSTGENITGITQSYYSAAFFSDASNEPVPAAYVGIVSYSEQNRAYIALELHPDYANVIEVLDIAQSIVID